MITAQMIDAAFNVLRINDRFVEREVVERAISAAMATPPPGGRPNLTPRQKVVFDFIRDHIQENETAPSIDEIRKALGYASKGCTHKIVTAIVDRGYLKRTRGQWRSLALV